jgi:transposase
MVQNGRLSANPEPGHKRRMRSKLERRQVVEETMRPGAPSVAVIARAHGVNANQVFNWRKLYHAGRLNDKVHAGVLLPVRIPENPHPVYPGVERLAIAPVVAGAIHIELGRARIRVEGSVDPENLRMVLEQLGR